MKIYFEALSKIPKKFIHDDTRATITPTGCPVIANPKFEPMIYNRKTGWQKLKFNKVPFNAK